MVTVLSNEEVEELVSMQEAVEAIEGALARKGNGAFVTPPRHIVPTQKGALVFTIGGDAEEGVVGYRVYAVFQGVSEEDQTIAVYDASNGALRGMVQGPRAGAMRTGALGGVAIKYAAREDAKVVALIGSGVQAGTQLEAAAAVRELEEVRVFSRTPRHRDDFSNEMSVELGLRVMPVGSPEAAIDGADIVIVATSSSTPVFEGALIKPGMHVTTIRLGMNSHELDPSVADRASAIFSDSMEQIHNYQGGFFLPEKLDEMSDLSEHVAAGSPVRASDDDITLYCSAGLAGTEVVIADVALRKRGL